jgi:hypothetical protein
MNISDKLTSAVTQYDAKQSKKKDYNIYALGIYLERCEAVVADVAAGADLRKAIVAGFTGRLVDFILKQFNLPISTDDEARGGMCYRPVAAKE